MKKISYIMVSLSFAAIMMFSSCKKPNNIVTPTGGGTVTNSFTASIGDGSKTYLDGVNVYWYQQDRIYVNGRDALNTYTIGQIGQNPVTEATFTNTEPGELVADNYFAAYQMRNESIQEVGMEYPTEFPYFSDSGNEMRAYFFVPQDQSQFCKPMITCQGPYTEMNTLDGCIPMAAYSSNRELVFNNLVNVIKLDLKAVSSSKEQGVVIIKNVSISSTGQNLWGRFSVVHTEEGLKPSTAELIASPTNPEDPTPEIYAKNLNLSLSSEQSSYLYFIIPVASVAENTIQINITGDDGTGTKVYTKDVTLKYNDVPNQLHKIKVDVEFEPMPFIYSVARNKYVQFSPSNLWYHYYIGYIALFKPSFYHFNDDQTAYTTEYTETVVPGSMSDYQSDIDHLVWTNYQQGAELFRSRAHYGWGYNVLNSPNKWDVQNPDNPNYQYNGRYSDYIHPFIPGNDLLFTNATNITPNPVFPVKINDDNTDVGIWRSLSVAEMNYLLGTAEGYAQDPSLGRNNAWEKCGKVKIKVRVGDNYNYTEKYVYGFLILADNFNRSGIAFPEGDYRLGGPYGYNPEQEYGYKDLTGTIQVYQGENEYHQPIYENVNIWDAIKDRGVVFLPSSGRSLCNHDYDENNPESQHYIHNEPGYTTSYCNTYNENGAIVPTTNSKFDGQGSFGAVYLSDGISLETIEPKSDWYIYPHERFKFNASCLYWDGSGNVGIIDNEETKIGRTIRLVKDFNFVIR